MHSPFWDEILDRLFTEETGLSREEFDGQLLKMIEEALVSSETSPNTWLATFEALDELLTSVHKAPEHSEKAALFLPKDVLLCLLALANTGRSLLLRSHITLLAREEAPHPFHDN